MVARYDRAMQSSRVLDPIDLDRPIRTALPALARGASVLHKLGITTPREALWYLPFRYDDFSDLRTLGLTAPDPVFRLRRSPWRVRSAVRAAES